MNNLKIIQVLLLEDNRAQADYIADILVNANNVDYKITHVFNIHELPFIKKNGVVDIVLINLDLLNNDFTDTIKQLTTTFPNVPIIILLTKNNVGLYSQSIRESTKCFLVKQNQDDLLLAKFIYLVIERIQLEQAINELHLQKHKASHDILTGLPNKSHFYRLISYIIKYTQNKEQVFALIHIDLDNFEYVNYTFNQVKGNDVLKTIAKRLKCMIDRNDVVARVGGDEFSIVLTNIDNKEAVNKFVQKLQNKIMEPIIIDEKQITLQATIGITLYPYDGDNVDRLNQNVDIIMYLLKKHNSGSYGFYKDIVSADAGKNLKFINNIKYGLKNDEFLIYFQPQIDFATKKIVGTEVLLRWKHKILGLLTPSKFSYFADQFGFSVLLDNFVIREACKWYSKLPRKLQGRLKLAINISTEQLSNEVFIENLMKAIVEFSISPKSIELEISEQVFEEEPTNINSLGITENVLLGKINQTIKILKNHGFRVAINDFGTGYSSINYLESFAIDTIKINSDYIKYLAYNLDTNNSIKHITTLANNLGLTLVAVGVEDIEQAELLFKSGCKYMQGEYFFKAMPADEIIQLLSG